jgi:hypothetical protein
VASRVENAKDKGRGRQKKRRLSAAEMGRDGEKKRPGKEKLGHVSLAVLFLDVSLIWGEIKIQASAEMHRKFWTNEKPFVALLSFRK